MFRFVFALLTVLPFCRAQDFPAFRWILEVDGSGKDQFVGIGTDAYGNVYVAGNTTSPNFPVKSAVQNHLASSGLSNCFVTKLDPSGNLIFSTYFGGSGGDFAASMTVDQEGNVYVTGATNSLDFPTTKGTYAPSAPPPVRPPGVAPFQSVPPPSFLFKLNPDGSLGYSTYFAYGQQVQAIAVDQYGSAFISGKTYGDLPATPGAYDTSFPPGITLEGPFVSTNDAFLTPFDATGSTLIYSTYLGVLDEAGTAVAIASDGSAYVGGVIGIYRMDATGSSLLAHSGVMSVEAMAIAADGTLYAAGLPGVFHPTAGAFQINPNPLPLLPNSNPPSLLTLTTPDAIAKLDPLLQVLAGTYFYGVTGSSIMSLALDASGNLYAAGYTSLGLPTRNPMFEGFGAGFLSELSGDLSTLLFSSYFGDSNHFGVQGVAVGSNGAIVIGGPEIVGNTIVCGSVCDDIISTPANIWVNSLTLAAPPALRIDSIVNAASLIDGPISGGEAIFVRGTGFGSDAQLLIGGSAVPAISTNATQITAIVPPGVPIPAADVVVQSGGAASNPVVVPIIATAPGIFSANGKGYGQGYILNDDGTLNTPSNPAAPGDKITIYATGIGPVSFTEGYAVTQFPSNVFIDGIFCAGVAAALGPVAGFPGNVYQLTIYVPNPANFTFPALAPVILQMNDVSSQYGVAISIAQ